MLIAAQLPRLVIAITMRLHRNRYDQPFCALVSGLVMMPSGIAMGILNPVAGKMYDRIGGRPLALLGFAIMTSAAVLLVTIMNTHTAAAMRTGVPEAAASAIGVRASFRTVAIVCAVCLVASLFIRDRGRRLGQQR